MRYAALLRAVNVGGSKPIGMADLRDFAAKLGFTNVLTLLQSGNLVFDARSVTESQLETEAAKRLKLETGFFVRSAADMEAIVGGNPFRREAKDDPGRLVVLFLKAEGDGAALQKAIKGREIAKGNGREIYVYYPDGQGRSKLTNALIARTLGTTVTARNWNTVLKLRDATRS